MLVEPAASLDQGGLQLLRLAPDRLVEIRGVGASSQEQRDNGDDAVSWTHVTPLRSQATGPF
jgi:hypothetical protein